MLNTILKLQQGVKLLGGSSTEKVPSNDIAEARKSFKEYNMELMEMKIPIRYMTHALIHIPDDVEYFGCGIERQSAWMDETFQGKMRQAVHSGNRPAEQIRNRLVQRYLYLLPTRQDGTIVDSQDLFELEFKKAQQKNSKERIVINYKIGRGANPTKTVTFPNFVLSTKFPNNVVLLKNMSVVVCLNLVEHPDTNVLTMICLKFENVVDAFTTPYLSSRYQTYVASQIGSRYEEYNVNNIKAKMLPLPFLPTDCSQMPKITDRTAGKWFVTALQHTVSE